MFFQSVTIYSEIASIITLCMLNAPVYLAQFHGSGVFVRRSHQHHHIAPINLNANEEREEENDDVRRRGNSRADQKNSHTAAASIYLCFFDDEIKKIFRMEFPTVPHTTDSQ